MRSLENKTEISKNRNGQPVREAAPSFLLTDYGNAERLVWEHGKDLRYVHAWGSWLAWTGARWEKDATGEVMRRAKHTVRCMRQEAAEEKDKNRRDELWNWASRSEHQARLNAMITLAKSEEDIPVQPDELDTDDQLLNVKNGTVDLRQGKLLNHQRSALLTKLAPVEYDASAECPRWKQFLQEVFDGEEDLIRYVQRAIGYSATGSTLEQCIFIPYGTGANGKNTLINTIAYTLGDYAQATRPELLLRKSRTGGPSESEAALHGARFVSTSETGAGQRFDEATVKRLTGGNTIRARFLRANEFEFRPTHKLWLATNHKPVIEDTDYAIWRRIQLIPFRVTFSKDEQDTSLEAKLKEEAPGILNWIIEGCLAWQKEGLTPAEAVSKATEQYRTEMDILASFLEDKCVVGVGMSVQSSRLYQAYRAWCQRTGEEAETQRGFGLRMTEQGIQRERKRDGIYYLGIGLQEKHDGRVPPSFTCRE